LDPLTIIGKLKQRSVSANNHHETSSEQYLASFIMECKERKLNIHKLKTSIAMKANARQRKNFSLLVTPHVKTRIEHRQRD
jgi:cell fate regulator YaaT (PSP1 superfamily)